MEEIIQEQKTVSEVTRKKANTYFFSKVAVNLVFIVLGTIFLNSFLYSMHSRATLARQEKNSEFALAAAADILERNTGNAEALIEAYHEGNQRILDDITLLLEQGLLDTLENADDDIRLDVFRDLAESTGMDYVLLMSPDGEIVMSQDTRLMHTNPAVTGDLTQENVNRILSPTAGKTGSVTPVLVKSRFGTFYFYSKPCTYQNRTHMLVIGEDASVINDQIETLGDTSAVLSRISVINDGFLFAVDRKTDLFLYYKNGEDLLTGQNARRCGLSEKAYDDGYSGREKILGESYYCFSRAFGEDTVLCAAVRTASVRNYGNYVLFWPLFGFVLVMVICLIYAVIVHNDFVRRAVTTDRFVLRKNSANPIYFDRSIFLKVVPLIFAGVLAVFGISFYTQTLVEITGGIAEANVALQEVTGRYEESQDSSKIIEDYYNNHFLSTAKTLSFILEEKPDALNTVTDRYHTAYDKDGNRYDVLDDEGNHLRSVSESALLQELCDKNGIDAIYIFDADGRVIATSTPNWFFQLSRSEEDQSYAFWQVLDGKTDSYVQAHMTNDLGKDTQYFGVVFDYYTTTDAEGNTVYVSRSAYEQAVAESGGARSKTAGGITQHSSMLQIEMDEDLAGKLLAPTSVDYILSTNMLDDGAIIMFDAGPDHTCLYSPVKASIGKSAAELGASTNAFTGMDYYGFSNINGVSYFTYFRYLNDYYIATAMPKSSMFVARLGIALITAGVCLALILVLILTVTMTTKEEELLYATMTEEQEDRGFNSAIFNIVLPSGRSVSTEKAAARWENRYIHWSEKGPEQKLGTILLVVFCALLIYVVLSAIGVQYRFTDASVIRYILSGAWDRSPNVFALSACALVMTAVILVIIAFRVPVRIITALLGTRGETIGRLLLSIVKYGCTIGGIFYCLYLLGIDSGSLLASAGILSLVIGLGAQSLIKDILAGVFIVFEGEFRVGDIVTIAGYRGTVMDIGLRTTKIMGPDGNIKIYNNSEISGVLNMTKEASLALCTIGIEYGQDVDYVEAVLKRDLPLLKEKNPLILDGPTYMGISELADSGVNILILCKCQEANVKGVTRFMNKEVLQIFYRNGINVPFPNVTVSQLDMTGRKTIEDFVPAETEEEKEE